MRRQNNGSRITEISFVAFPAATFAPAYVVNDANPSYLNASTLLSPVMRDRHYFVIILYYIIYIAQRG